MNRDYKIRLRRSLDTIAALATTAQKAVDSARLELSDAGDPMIEAGVHHVDAMERGLRIALAELRNVEHAAQALKAVLLPAWVGHDKALWRGREVTVLAGSDEVAFALADGQVVYRDSTELEPLPPCTG